MNTFLRTLVLSALLTVTFGFGAASTAVAQKASEKIKVDGKISITKLFDKALTTAADSTVSVRYNSKEVMLGTIVDANGGIVSKGSDLIAAMRKPATEDGGLIVRLKDGKRLPARLVAYDESSDLAWIKVDAKELTPVKFVEKKNAEAGNLVAAPGMDGAATTSGVISAPVRKLYREEAVIDNGNKGYLGVILDTARDDAVIIKEMEDTSPAKKAKLLVGDQIVSIEDRTVTKFDDLKAILNNYKPGDKVKVLVRRKPKDKDDIEDMTFEVTLGKRSSFDRSAMQNSMGSELSGRRTGFPMVITTDMVIDPADCGSPLVDLEGRVLGIVIARAGRVESWVLPPEVIKPLITDFKAGKHTYKQ